jgi:hypothetical protein
MLTTEKTIDPSLQDNHYNIKILNGLEHDHQIFVPFDGIYGVF